MSHKNHGLENRSGDGIEELSVSSAATKSWQERGTGPRPKVLNRLQTHATRKHNTEGQGGETRRRVEASKLCETRENVTTEEKHHTFLWKDVWRKEQTSQSSPRLLNDSMETHTPGGDSNMSTLSEEIVALSILAHRGDGSDPMTESLGIDAVSLTESSTESETQTPPSSVLGKEQEPVRGHRHPQ